jgi:hypothetical protein
MEQKIIVQEDTKEVKFAVAVVKGKPVLEGLEALKNVVDRKVSVIGDNQAIAPSNISHYEDERTENNKYVKDIKAQLTKAEDDYLEPFNAIADQVNEALKPLIDANKAFGDKILEAKKTKFKNDVRDEFTLIARPDANGELPDFEAIFDPSWYGDRVADWKDKLATKIRKAEVADEKVTAYIRVETTKSQLEDLERYIISQRINYTLNKD